MYQYDFFFIYSPKGGSSAERLYGLLCQRGYRCVFRGSSAGYEAFFADVRETIRRSRAIIMLVSEDLTRSKYASMEMAYALSDACGRGKRIFPVVTTDGLPDELVRYIGNYEEIRVNSGEGHAWEAVAERIDLSMRDQSVDSQLLEQLSEYRRLKQDNRWADVLCRIIERTQQKVTDTPPHSPDRSARLRELCSLHEQLAEYHGLYDQESRKMAKCIVRTLNRTKALLTGESFPEGVYFAALAVRFIYLDREIRTECADILSDGDVHGVNDAGYLEEQKPHLAVMDAYLADGGEQDEDLLTFVRDTEKYRLTGICNLPSGDTERSENRRQPAPITKEEEVLRAVAGFIREGNKLFDVLSEQGMAEDFLKCLMTSYERLKNYCVTVGADSLAVECADRLVEIRRMLTTCAEDPAKGSTVANAGIRSLLGFTVHGMEGYDVFISFKHEDADMAETVYSLLRANLLEPFWSKVSLPELSKSDYAEAIDEALDRARHFVVVLSDLAYMESNWVSYEMKTFNSEIREGRKQGSNFIIVATDEVYDQIMSSNKKVLPINFRWCQVVRMRECSTMLLQYVGKR